MPQRIAEDHYRYRQIIGGQVRDDLKGLITSGGFTRQRPNGRGKMSVNIPEIDLPRIVHGRAGEGVGKGEGEVGDTVGKDPGKGKGGKPGDGAGEGIQVEVDLEYILKLLKDELQLPDLKPKDSKTFEEERFIYNGLSRNGPMSLLHKKRTMLQAMKREAASGNLGKVRHVPGFNKPVSIVTPVNDDFRFRQYNIKRIPSHNAAIFFMRDGSGSMDQEKCEVVSDMAWWLDFYIRSFYARTERVYVWHDTEAKEVSEEEFYGLRYGGGTKCSSATRHVAKQIKTRYKPETWNLYCFYFGDGENSSDDNPTFVKHLKNQLGPNVVNMFGFTQIFAYGYDWSLKRYVDEKAAGVPHVRTTAIDRQGKSGVLDRDAEVMRALKDLLGRDRTGAPAVKSNVEIQEV